MLTHHFPYSIKDHRMNITVNQRTQEGIQVAEIIGDIDRSTAQEIEARLLPQIQAGTRLILDMRGVNYMSSAGLRMLLIMYRELKEHQGEIALSGLSDRLQDIMAVTGFLKHFTICQSVEQGVALLQSPPESA